MNIISYRVMLQSQHLEDMKQLQMSPPTQRGLAFPDTVSRYQILLQRQDQQKGQPKHQRPLSTYYINYFHTFAAAFPPCFAPCLAADLAPCFAATSRDSFAMALIAISANS